MIELKTVELEGIISQRLYILYFIYIGVSFDEIDGQHFGLVFGIGPFELDFKIRYWSYGS